MEKLERLEAELFKYTEKLRQMEQDWSASRGGSAGTATSIWKRSFGYTGR